MAESELEKIINKAFRAAFWLMVIHALIMSLIMTMVVIAICLVVASVARPTEQYNNQHVTVESDRMRDVIERIKRKGSTNVDGSASVTGSNNADAGTVGRMPAASNADRISH